MKRRAPQDLPNYHRGTRQRLADAAAAIPHNQPRPSRVASMLLHDWSWGLGPATKVQKTCQGILEDNDDMGQATHPEVRKLASLGNSGQTPGNCNRDLTCFQLKKPPVMTALTSFQVRLKTSALTHRDVQSKVLWPHQLFALLYKHHKDTFTQRILGGSSGNLPRFWEAMAKTTLHMLTTQCGSEKTTCRGASPFPCMVMPFLSTTRGALMLKTSTVSRGAPSWGEEQPWTLTS